MVITREDWAISGKCLNDENKNFVAWQNLNDFTVVGLGFFREKNSGHKIESRPI